jgi:hypothetical protein
MDQMFAEVMEELFGPEPAEEDTSPFVPRSRCGAIDHGVLVLGQHRPGMLS